MGTELFLVPSPVGERKSEPAAAGVLAWACVCLGLSLALCGKCLVELWEGIRALAGRPAHDSTGALSGAALCQEPSAWRLYPYNCATSSLEILPGHDGRGQGEPHLPSSTPKPNLQVLWSLRRQLTASASAINLCEPISALLFFLCSRNFNILVLLPH